MEEGIPPVYGDRTTNAEPWRVRCQFGGQRQEVAFVAARAMQQNERDSGGIYAGKEAVGVYRVRHRIKAVGLVRDGLTS